MAVRPVTGTIRDPNGEPLPDFPITFTVKPTQFTEIAHFPQKAAEVTTEPDGTFSVELVQGLRYVVGLAGAFVRSGSAVVYPKGTTFDIVVPEGEGPIALEAIRAADATPPDDPTLVDFALTHMEATNNPHSVTAHQTGAYTTGEVDSLIEGVEAGAASWGNIGGDIEDQQDLQDALDAIETTPGPPGPDGDSAYDVAVANGFEGSEEDWLASLVGEPGDPGEAGPPGNDGASAYEVAVAEGFEGSEQDWLDSLVGEQGPPGEAGDTGPAGDPGPGVAAGGTEGQVLGKASGDDYDTEWIDPPAGVELAGDGTAETAARSDHQHFSPDHAQSVAIGPNTDLGSASGAQSKTAIGYGASATSVAATAVGQNASAAGNATAIGGSAGAPGISATAIGRSSAATASRAIAIGHTALSNTADTAVIRVNDLDVQRSNGTGVTRYSLYTEDGTKLWLTAESDGNGGYQLALTEA